MVKILSQSDKWLRRKTRKFCADKQAKEQTDKQTDKRKNGPKYNTLSFGKGNNAWSSRTYWAQDIFEICSISFLALSMVKNHWKN